MLVTVMLTSANVQRNSRVPKAEGNLEASPVRVFRNNASNFLWISQFTVPANRQLQTFAKLDVPHVCDIYFFGMM